MIMINALSVVEFGPIVISEREALKPHSLKSPYCEESPGIPNKVNSIQNIVALVKAKTMKRIRKKLRAKKRRPNLGEKNSSVQYTEVVFYYSHASIANLINI